MKEIQGKSILVRVSASFELFAMERQKLESLSSDVFKRRTSSEVRDSEGSSYQESTVVQAVGQELTTRQPQCSNELCLFISTWSFENRVA